MNEEAETPNEVTLQNCDLSDVVFQKKIFYHPAKKVFIRGMLLTFFELTTRNFSSKKVAKVHDNSALIKTIDLLEF